MICIVLVCKHEPLLEAEIEADTSGTLEHLEGLPLPLMPSGAGEQRFLDNWWVAVGKRGLFDKVYLVTNAKAWKYYERWGTANDFPPDNIVNNGTTTAQTALGELADVELVLRSKKITDDVMVVSADKVFYPDSVDFQGIKQFFRKRQMDLVACFHPELADCLSADASTIVEIDQKQNVSVPLAGPPFDANNSPSSSIPGSPGAEAGAEAASVLSVGDEDESEDSKVRVCPAAYCFKQETLAKTQEYMSAHPAAAERTLERFLSWLTRHGTVAGMRCRRTSIWRQGGMSPSSATCAPPHFFGSGMSAPKLRAARQANCH